MNPKRYIKACEYRDLFEEARAESAIQFQRACKDLPGDFLIHFINNCQYHDWRLAGIRCALREGKPTLALRLERAPERVVLKFRGVKRVKLTDKRVPKGRRTPGAERLLVCAFGRRGGRLTFHAYFSNGLKCAVTFRKLKWKAEDV